MDKNWLIGGLTALVLAPLGAILYRAEVGLGDKPERSVGVVHGPLNPAAKVAKAATAATTAADAGATNTPPVEATNDGSPMPSVMKMAGYSLAPRHEADYRLGGLDLPGETDYRDLAAGGAVPLTAVADFEEIPVSEHFRLGDFAANDGAPFARIAPELVELLDSLSDYLDRRVHVTSAYRHPALNFREGIEGAVESPHMAGYAADIWVDDTPPLEAAEAALEVQGCGIGLGLGENFLHVDVRAYPASWARPGAAMAEADFDLWLLERCSDSFGEEARAAIEAAACSEPPTGLNAAEAFRAEMTDLATFHRHPEGSGAVLLDVRRYEAGADSVSTPRLAYLSPDNPLLRAMRLVDLVRRAEQNENFVFVVIEPDGSHRAGLMRYDGENAELAAGSPAEPAGSCE